MGPKKTPPLASDKPKKTLKKITIEQKKEIIENTFLVNKKDKESPSKRQIREVTPEVELPTVLMEGDSPSRQ